MRNPFKFTAKQVASWYEAAKSADVAPAASLIGTTLVMPIVIPVSFVYAFFLPSEAPHLPGPQPPPKPTPAAKETD